MINALTIEQKGTQQSLSNLHLQQQSTTSKQSTNMSIITPDKSTLSFNPVLCYASANNSTINECIDCLAFNDSLHLTINKCINHLACNSSIHLTVN